MVVLTKGKLLSGSVVTRQIDNGGSAALGVDTGSYGAYYKNSHICQNETGNSYAFFDLPDLTNFTKITIIMLTTFTCQSWRFAMGLSPTNSIAGVAFGDFYKDKVAGTVELYNAIGITAYTANTYDISAYGSGLKLYSEVIGSDNTSTSKPATMCIYEVYLGV
jgi:hypothetical protein